MKNAVLCSIKWIWLRVGYSIRPCPEKSFFNCFMFCLLYRWVTIYFPFRNSYRRSGEWRSFATKYFYDFLSYLHDMWWNDIFTCISSHVNNSWRACYEMSFFFIIRWTITFKIMAHQSSTLSQLITSSNFILILAISKNFAAIIGKVAKININEYKSKF